MNKIFSLMMAGSIGLSSVPMAFAQSVSSESSSSSISSSLSSSSSTSSSSLSSSSSSLSSDESSSARYYSRPSSSSSESSVSVRTRTRTLQVSSASTSSSSVRTRSSRSSSSDDVAPGAFGGRRSSVPGRGDEMRSMIPEQCADLTGRSRAMCVIRLSQRSSSSRSSSSLSSVPSAGTGATMTSEETLGQLLRMSAGQGTRIDVMRHLCGMVMGEFVSTCAQGENNLRDFNRHLNLWFTDLGRALSDFMTDLNENGDDQSDDYFWNDVDAMFPWTGTGSTGSGSVKGWQWMNDTDGEPLLDDSLEEDDTELDGGMSADNDVQRKAWDACVDRQEGPGKARCIRQELQRLNMESQGGGEDL